MLCSILVDRSFFWPLIRNRNDNDRKACESDEKKTLAEMMRTGISNDRFKAASRSQMMLATIKRESISRSCSNKYF